MTKPPLPAAAKPPVAPTVAPLDDDELYYDFAELSCRAAKRPRILFFGRSTFSDNTKYLFLAATQAKLDAEVIWCSWSKPLIAQLATHGIRAFDLGLDFRKSCTLLLEASVAVFCENPASALALNNCLCGCLAGATKVQLWHGVSVKQLDLMLMAHLDVRNTEFRRQLRFASRVDYFLSTSAALDGFWLKAFGCTKVVRAGQPRNEVIVRPPSAREMVGAELPPNLTALLRSGGKRKLLVTPTWQRGVPMFISTPAFYERLAKWSERNDAVAFVKAHPFMRKSEIPEDIPGKVCFLGAGVDLYPWMAQFDAMITDYSSIMFDFLLTGKPVFTFNTRTQVAYGFEPDYSLIPPGDFRYDFDATTLEASLDQNLASHPLRAEQRVLCDRLFETAPAEACTQLLHFLQECSHAVVNKSVTVIDPGKFSSANFVQS